MHIKIFSRIKRTYWFVSTQLGLDVVKTFKSIGRGTIYFRDLLKFRSMHSGRIELQPCLHDRFEEGGVARGEYFWQDLIVSRWIFKHSPNRHVDVGSRIDGFVAHVASFRNIEVLDVRPISIQIPGISFHQADLMEPGFGEKFLDKFGPTDSLSCLHALEHFGLGRYGDKLDPEGYKKGLNNLSKMLSEDGVLYLSTPIGRRRVVFNANHVFDSSDLIGSAGEFNLIPEEIYTLDGSELLKYNSSIEFITESSKRDYLLAIISFRKKMNILD